MVTDEVLQGRLLQPAGAEGGTAVGILEDGVASQCTLWREYCKRSQRDNISAGCAPELSIPMIYGIYGRLVCIRDKAHIFDFII